MRVDSSESDVRAFATSTIRTWLDSFPITTDVLSQPLVSPPALHLPTLLIDEGSSEFVKTMTTDLLDTPAMGSYSYKEKLSLSPADSAILKHRWAGLSDHGVGGALDNSFSGTMVLAPKGIKKLLASGDSL